jgi:hypothetical protein
MAGLVIEDLRVEQRGENRQFNAFAALLLIWPKDFGRRMVHRKSLPATWALRIWKPGLNAFDFSLPE